MRYPVRGFFILVCFFVFANEGFVQADELPQANRPHEWFWFNLGMIPYPFSSTWGVVVSGQRETNVISARYIGGIEPSGSDWRLWEASALYGKSVKSQRGLASMSVGLGVIGGDEPRILMVSIGANGAGTATPASPRPSTTLGIPIEVQLFWAPTSFVGIGLYGFGNLNTEKSFAGALLAFQFGRLR